ncbi:hypothetical protein [Pseudomonas monteilii]|uniref:hypothetical protein n=1 Tax=Pseudomonas monteilii TaxID=76759 RepID=UPI001FD217C1|nr:hypothetical protein [Pseudomonas monteilii]MCJ7854591.1 hypothetical protein [Pseudomonas monteilii]
MSEYDPQANYDFLDLQGSKMGEVRQGKLYMSGERMGHLDNGVFYDQGEPAGKLEGLTIIRDEDRTPFHLVLQEPEQA